MHTFLTKNFLFCLLFLSTSLISMNHSDHQLKDRIRKRVEFAIALDTPGWTTLQDPHVVATQKILDHARSLDNARSCVPQDKTSGNTTCRDKAFWPYIIIRGTLA